MSATASTATIASAYDERYRHNVDGLADYTIYFLDAAGNVSSWNAGAERANGYSKSEIIGRSFLCFYSPEDRAAGLPERALATARLDGRSQSEGWRLRQDGTRYWASAIIDAVYGASGDILGFAVLTQDLSERKTAQSELQQSEKQFQLLVQGVTDYAIYMLDPGGHVSSWNSGAERIKGYTDCEIVGKHFSTFYTEEDRAANMPGKALQTASDVGRFEKEGWRVRKDGSRFWASVVIDAIRDGDGRLLGYAKITRDITEKLNAQNALERAREELFHAQKMEAVGQLTGGIAHDFNNLLTAVLGSLEIARKRAADGQDITPLLDNAIQGAQRGASLTQRMLAFSRRQELKLVAVDVIDLIQGMMDMLQRSIGPTISIESRFAAALPLVTSDPNQLESAILNLVVNARDAMPDGGALVLSARPVKVGANDASQLNPGGYVCLSIEDSGQGMDAETLQNSTTPFFTTKGVGKGTGLGLSMVQGLMGQSGGKLVLRSAVGRGTVAELWLPVAEDGQEKEPAPSDVPTTSVDQPLTVLAVDDDALVLMNTVLMLEDLGYTVVEAHSARKALDVFQSSGPFDLIITDHAMPGMTGSQLAAEIRKLQPDMKMVLATGYAELPPGGDEKLLRLAKPFTQAQLASVIAKAMTEPTALN